MNIKAKLKKIRSDVDLITPKGEFKLPKWVPKRSDEEIMQTLELVWLYMLNWVSKVTHPSNINKGVEANTPLSMREACLEAGINSNTVYTRMNESPPLRIVWDKIKEVRREKIRNAAESNIQKAITWKYKDLSNKEVVDFSFRMLERTDKNYNPKQVIEQGINIEGIRSTNEIMADLSMLLNKNG